MRSRLTIVLTASVTAAMLAGCVGGGNDMAKLRQQAEAALGRWADAVAAAGGPAIVPVGDLARQVGDWEADVGDNNKQALLAGFVEVVEALPAGAPADGDITWEDGSTTQVPLISAEEAVSAIQAAAAEPCDGCTALRITGARLTTGPIETSRGPATGPLWELALEGTAVKVTFVAVANRVRVVPPPWDENDPPVGVWIDLARGAVGSTELTVEFVGAPLPGGQGCGEDYTTEAVESDLAVVVIVVRHPALTLGACTGAGALRTAVANLADPLADRVVLQVYDGTPVRVVLAP